MVKIVLFDPKMGHFWPKKCIFLDPAYFCLGHHFIPDRYTFCLDHTVSASVITHGMPLYRWQYSLAQVVILGPKVVILGPKNGQKWSKVVKSGQKWSKVTTMARGGEKVGKRAKSGILTDL